MQYSISVAPDGVTKNHKTKTAPTFPFSPHKLRDIKQEPTQACAPGSQAAPFLGVSPTLAVPRGFLCPPRSGRGGRAGSPKLPWVSEQQNYYYYTHFQRRGSWFRALCLPHPHTARPSGAPISCLTDEEMTREVRDLPRDPQLCRTGMWASLSQVHPVICCTRTSECPAPLKTPLALLICCVTSGTILTLSESL